MESLPYYLRQQGRELCSRVGIGRPGGYRILLLHAALVAVFGVYIPWLKGVDFLDPVITAAYACLGILFAAPAAAQAFANDNPISMPDVIARIVMAVLYGEIIAVTVLICGFGTVYLTHSRHFVVAPALDTLVAAGLLGITGSFALAAAAAWITLRFSANAARGAMRVVFLLMLLVFFYRSRWLPDVADTAALVCFVIAAAEFLALRRLVVASSSQ
ncbi:MAG: hypothetical protein ABSB35_08765 [Bryobacteraceae bacterium]|jgi:hypothetical protein